MAGFLGRAVLSVLGGFAGSAAGFAIHQLRTRQSDIDRGEVDITVAAPPVAAGIASLIGILTGRRGPLFAFLGGAALTAAFGTTLDERVTGLAAGQPSRASSTSSSHSSG